MVEQPEETVLRLSEAFGGEADIEVCVTMLNINYGKNKDLMQTCQPLKEYAWLVDKIRFYQKEFNDIEAAIDAAIVDMPDNFLIKGFLSSHKTEVKGMFLTEYDEKKVLEQERRDGICEGMREFAHNVAVDMLKEKMPLKLIAKISKLSEEAILKIANSLNITIQ